MVPNTLADDELMMNGYKMLCVFVALWRGLSFFGSRFQERVDWCFLGSHTK